MREMNCTLVIDQNNGTIKSNDLNIIYFDGSESVSSLYRFEITLAISLSNESSQWKHVKEVLNSSARLSIDTNNNKKSIAWNGIITSLAQDGRDNEYCYFKFVLEPEQTKLRWLFSSDVYIEKHLDEVIGDVMTESGFEHSEQIAKESLKDDDTYDYVFDSNKGDSFSKMLKNSHQHFTCQFEESHLDFIQRRSEFYGVYYTFAQLKNKSCMVFSHDLKVPKMGSDVFLKAEYNPVFGSEESHDTIAVTHLSKHLCAHANQLYLQRRSTAFNTVEAKLTPASHELSKHDTEVALYSIHDQFEVLENNAESDRLIVGNRRISGKYLANIRSGAIAAKQLEVSGVAISPGMVAGSFIHIDECNGDVKSNTHKGDEQRDNDYFVISVKHEWGSSDKSQWKHDKAILQKYHADFVLHPCFDDGNQPIAFYPQQTVKTPCVERMVSGFIDGQPYTMQDNPGATDITDVTYPHIDPFGRYRVRFSFSKKRQKSFEKNSSWLRLASPYAGGVRQREFDKHGKGINPDTNYDYSGGMHFPLRAGTEVLIAFVNGDPDYPVIVSALANDKAPSPVSGAIQNDKGEVIKPGNKNQFALQTPVGNRMMINDVAKEKEGDTLKNSPYSSWNFYTPAMDSQFNLGGYYYKGVDKKTYASSGFMLSSKGTGVIQSDGILYIKSKEGVKISSGNHSPEDKFKKFVDKASQTDVGQTPESASHEGHHELTTEELHMVEEALKKINHESNEAKVVSHDTEVVVKDVGIGFNRTVAGIDVDIFAGGVKVDAVFAVAIAEVEVCLGKVEFLLNERDKVIDNTHHHRIHAAKEEEVKADVTQRVDIKKIEEALSKEIAGKTEKKIMASVEEKITKVKETYTILNQKVEKFQQDITKLNANYDEFKALFLDEYSIGSKGGKTQFKINKELVELKNATSSLEIKANSMKLNCPDITIKGDASITIDTKIFKVPSIQVIQFG